MLCQGCLEGGQGHARIHGDREVIHGVVHDSVELADADDWSGILEGRSPVQATTQAGGDPGPSIAMQVGDELAKLIKRIGCEHR